MWKTSEWNLEASVAASAGYQPFQLNPQPRQPVPSNRIAMALPFPSTPSPSQSMTFLPPSLPQNLPTGSSPVTKVGGFSPAFRSAAGASPGE